MYVSVHMSWYHMDTFHIYTRSARSLKFLSTDRAVIKGLTDWVCNTPDLTIKQTYYHVSLPDGSSTHDVTCAAS